jgi:hypothetical protein
MSAWCSSDSVEARPPGWMTRLPVTAMNLYGFSPAVCSGASFVTIAHPSDRSVDAHRALHPAILSSYHLNT